IGLSNYEFNSISQAIKEKLVQTPLTLKDLVDETAHLFAEDKVVSVVQWLTDQHDLAYDEKGLLHWQGK
nr:hypothetical protein [Bacteroidales bacterium]